MVASKNEIEDITKIILMWVPETYAYDMMTEVWDNLYKCEKKKIVHSGKKTRIIHIGSVTPCYPIFVDPFQFN